MGQRFLTDADDTEVIFLGTGVPTWNPARAQAGYAVRSQGKVYMVDAGAGIMQRAIQAGLLSTQTTITFVSHLHSDHQIGLIDFIISSVTERWIAGYKQNVYGPKGIKHVVDKLMEADKEDIYQRTHDPGSDPNSAVHYYDVDVTEYPEEGGVVFNDGIMKVSAIHTKHVNWRYAYGFKFEPANGGCIVFSGDTIYSETIRDAAVGCDLLIHEVYSKQGAIDLGTAENTDWAAYMAIAHTPEVDLGKLANEANPKQLIISHGVRLGRPQAEMVANIRQSFSGPLYWANDFDVYSLKHGVNPQP